MARVAGMAALSAGAAGLLSLAVTRHSQGAQGSSVEQVRGCGCVVGSSVCFLPGRSGLRSVSDGTDLLLMESETRVQYKAKYIACVVFPYFYVI